MWGVVEYLERRTRISGVLHGAMEQATQGSGQQARRLDVEVQRRVFRLLKSSTFMLKRSPNRTVRQLDTTLRSANFAKTRHVPRPRRGGGVEDSGHAARGGSQSQKCSRCVFVGSHVGISDVATRPGFDGCAVERGGGAGHAQPALAQHRLVDDAHHGDAGVDQRNERAEQGLACSAQHR